MNFISQELCFKKKKKKAKYYSKAYKLQKVKYRLKLH